MSATWELSHYLVQKIKALVLCSQRHSNPFRVGLSTAHIFQPLRSILRNGKAQVQGFLRKIQQQHHHHHHYHHHHTQVRLELEIEETNIFGDCLDTKPGEKLQVKLSQEAVNSGKLR